MQLPPLSLYVHVPWCLKKCPYCDFNSHTFSQVLPENRYIDTLLEDFRQDLGYVQGRTLSTIFFGGGTPSLLSPAAIDRLLKGINQLIDFSPAIEITLEANPGTTDATKFLEYRELGINRLSIGIQSFDDTCLASLGRVHDGKEARLAVSTALDAGFTNLNLDLMHGLPNQDQTLAEQDLEIALSYEVPHISWYQLTIEPNTVFYNRPPPLPEENLLWSIQDSGSAYLEKQMVQYEISAYARPGKECQHNLNYWRFGDYLGIGAGAHGKVTLEDGKQLIRTGKTRVPEHYMQRNSDTGKSPNRFGNINQVDISELPLEFLMNSLRLKTGVPEQLFVERTGLPLTVISDYLQRNKQSGMLVDGPVIQATEKGYRYLNSLLEDLL